MEQGFKRIEIGYGVAFLKVTNRNAIVYVPTTASYRGRQYYLSTRINQVG
jgi:hypothetical protein